MVPEDLPEAWAKQQRLFKLMYDVACRYVESKGKASVRHAEKSMSDGDFEMFFKEAGIVLPAGQPPHGAHSGPGGHVDFMPAEGSASMDLGVLQETFMPRTENHGAELANWFDQNHQMFRMIEDGL